MKFRYTFILYLLLYATLCGTTLAQNVEIPDANLRNAIREALNLPTGAPITQADILRLESLPAERRGIIDLTGLEYALNLKVLLLQGNSAPNLAPLAGLTKLENLALIGNSISDISPLASLTRLNRLEMGSNLISDIRPLAGLTALKHLTLQDNFISDVRPLASLYNLERLEIQNNWISDHSVLGMLTLSHFTYDQSCEIPPDPLEPRLENRTFPSIFAAFITNIDNRPDLDRIEDYWERRITEGAQHDMFFSSLDTFNQRFTKIGEDWTVQGFLPNALDRRNRYFARNPNMVFIAEVRIRDYGDIDAFPDDHPYWLRKPNGEIAGDSHSRLINYAHPVVQDIIVEQALAVSRCGLYDGIFFDWWDDHQSSVGDYIPNEIAQRARDNIIRRIREATRPQFLIMGNTNDRIIPRTGPHMNGGFMESIVPPTQESFARVRDSLQWLEENLREPRINALQGGSNTNEPPDSPTNLRWMRATTAMSLTHSDGYVLFGIGSADAHYWYDFWDADLGRPVGAKAQLYDEDTPGLYIREFTNGWAVYNHSGEAQVITLPEEAQGVASKLMGAEHTLPNLDGEMYLRVKPKNPADVNGDGAVNILDLVIVAQGLGTNNPEADVNGDGVVNVFDLVFVANEF